MSVENHPAFAEERDRLQQTLAQIVRQYRRSLSTSEIKIEDVDQDEESMHAIRAAQEALETMRDDRVDRLKVAVREPYFGRIDFQEQGYDDPDALYIGKSGFEKENSTRPLVIDWRAPVASLFYASASGGDEFSTYYAPDGLIEGILWLKRNLAVKGGKLQHIADAMVKGNAEEAPGGDTFLLYRLQESRDAKLRDIVSSIQSEQNAIIRAPQDRPLIIQGVAGSGKTTVALHRLAYLLYTYQDTMDSNRMVIFAPNRMFLDYIAEVLPELGVGGIKQVTFQDWGIDQIEENLQVIPPAERLESLFAPGIDPGAGADAPGRFKGTLFFQEVLDRALMAFETHFVPDADLVLWKGARIPYREVYEWFHEQYRAYPLNTRKERIISRVRTWAKGELDNYRGTLEEPERKRAMVTAVRQYLAMWPNHTPLSLYKEILGLGAPKGRRVVELGFPEIPAAVLREAREIFARRFIAPEDLAPLVYLQEKLHGLREDRELDHVVIDEAQDFSPFQISLLRRLTKNDSFTILGDLSQGIHTYAGIKDWAEFIDLFPPDRVEFHVLQQSYRSTYEIMTFANEVLIRSGALQALAKPVFRAGDQVRVSQVDRDGLVRAIAGEVRRMQEHHASVAVIGRSAAEVEGLYTGLMDLGLKPERVTADQSRYQGGLSVIPSYLVKGLEFDGVIVASADANNYRLNTRDARLLYVSLTRALHDLSVFYCGERSPLLGS